MQRSLHGRQAKTFRKLRELACVSLAQLAADSGIALERLRGFEYQRTRLSEREALSVYAVLFQVVATRVGQMRDSERMLEVLDQIPCLDIDAPDAIPAPAVLKPRALW